MHVYGLYTGSYLAFPHCVKHHDWNQLEKERDYIRYDTVFKWSQKELETETK